MVLLREWMIFRQVRDPLVDAYVGQHLQTRNDHSRGYQDACTPSPIRTAGTVDPSLPLRPKPLLKIVPALLQGCSAAAIESIGQVSTNCPHLRSLETVRHAEMRCDLVNHREQRVSIVSLTCQRLCFLECRHLLY